MKIQTKTGIISTGLTAHSSFDRKHQRQLEQNIAIEKDHLSEAGSATKPPGNRC